MASRLGADRLVGILDMQTGEPLQVCESFSLPLSRLTAAPGASQCGLVLVLLDRRPSALIGQSPKELERLTTLLDRDG